jgi:hypothetical protein
MKQSSPVGDCSPVGGAQGVTVDDILDDYPALEPDDVRACLAYAHAVIAHDSLDAVAVEAG